MVQKAAFPIVFVILEGIGPVVFEILAGVAVARRYALGSFNFPNVYLYCGEAVKHFI